MLFLALFLLRRILYLLLQLTAVLGFEPLSAVEFLLGNVFEVVRWLHMQLLVLGWWRARGAAGFGRLPEILRHWCLLIRLHIIFIRLGGGEIDELGRCFLRRHRGGLAVEKKALLFSLVVVLQIFLPLLLLALFLLKDLLVQEMAVVVLVTLLHCHEILALFI